MKAYDGAWETFICTSCGVPTTRLAGSFDFPVCATCCAYDEIDPSGKLKRERMKGVQVELPGTFPDIVRRKYDK